MNEETKLILEALELLLRDGSSYCENESMRLRIKDLLNPKKERTIAEKTKDALSDSVISEKVAGEKN